MRRAVTAAILLVLASSGLGCGLKPRESFKMNVQRAQQLSLPPISFSFSYAPQFERVSTAADDRSQAYITLVAKKGRRLREWVEVSFLDTHGQRRDSAAFLPILMEEWKDRTSRAFPGYRIVQEGLTKVGELRAYQLFFTATDLPPGAQRSSGAKAIRAGLQGRLLLVPRPGLTGGVAITMIAGPAAGFERTTQIGQKGLSESILGSFKF